MKLALILYAAVVVYGLSVLVGVTTAQNVDCAALANAGNCDFYTECVEAKFQCGAEGYPIGYGDKYCRRFEDNLDCFTPNVRHCMLSNIQLFNFQLAYCYRVKLGWIVLGFVSWMPFSIATCTAPIPQRARNCKSLPLTVIHHAMLIMDSALTFYLIAHICSASQTFLIFQISSTD